MHHHQSKYSCIKATPTHTHPRTATATQYTHRHFVVSKQGSNRGDRFLSILAGLDIAQHKSTITIALLQTAASIRLLFPRVRPLPLVAQQGVPPDIIIIHVVVNVVVLQEQQMTMAMAKATSTATAANFGAQNSLKEVEGECLGWWLLLLLLLLLFVQDGREVVLREDDDG